MRSQISGFRFRVSGAWRLRLLLGIWVFGCLGVSNVAAATFEEQRKAISATIAKQPEAAIRSLLQAGIEEGKPVLAAAEAEKWMRQNVPQVPMTLYYAARAAELSGDLKGAIALYQQYLKKADLKSESADEAVYVVYTLLIHRLNDSAGAYSFSRTEGDRLLVCPRAKQFDKWFLDQAVHYHRRDVLAVVNRLTAAIKAGYPEDLLVARYDNYFRWLLHHVNEGGGFRRSWQVTQNLYDAYKDLVSVMNFDEELKLQLDWAISVRAYVQSMTATDPSKVVNRSGKAGKKSGKKSGKKGRKKGKEPVEAVVDEGPAAEVSEAPIAEAKALLSKYPHNAEFVFIGWAGGTKDNHPHHTGESTKYWPHEIDAKMGPIIDALKRLPAEERGHTYFSMVSGWREPRRVSLKESKAFTNYLKANPELVQRKLAATPLTKSWWDYTPEEASALAPRIVNNRHPDVSVLRAIASGGKNLDKILAALKGPEAWRLSHRNLNGHDVADRLWHYCGRPGGNEKRDKEKISLAAFVKTLAYKGNVKAESPANQRIAEFRKLWADFKSPRPKIRDVRNVLKTVLQFTPEVIPELLKDANPEAGKLVRGTLESNRLRGPDPFWKELDRGTWVRTGSYNPSMMELVRHHRGLERVKRDMPQKCKPYPLEDAFRKQIAADLKQNKLTPWHIQAWINMQWPENNAEQVKLMEALFKSPAWKTMPFEVEFSAREWFGKAAMTPGQIVWLDAGNPALVCKDLRGLKKDANLVATVEALSNVIEGAKKSPVYLNIQGLDSLAAVSEEIFTDPEVMNRVLDITDGLRYASSVKNERPPFANRLMAYVKKKRGPMLIHRTAGFLWSYASAQPRGNLYRELRPLTASLIEAEPEAASALARTGVDTLSRSRGAYGFNPASHVPEMKALYGKASMKLGLVSIPVSRNHPAYPVYKSQAEWMIANEDSAWTMLDESWDQLMPVHRALSMDYLTWVLQRTIYTREDARQEELVKALLEWSGEQGSPWTPSQKIDLEISYGDIALQMGQVENAHKIFTRAQQNQAYAGMVERHKATLRRVKVERIAKRYDDALKTLNQLDMERIPELWAPSRYARAEVYYDMEEFDNAADDIDAILARDPDHGEAKIMQGKVQLKRQKLMEASELDVGSKNAKNTLVPGEKLKVTLIDPTLAVSGAGTEVEVAVWATSGDKEHFFLRQFGDEKTKFRGEVETALGKPSPDDRVLQVIGDDKIYYAYSEKFRKKMNDMEEKRGGPITVRSDAILMASARRLLSEAEQRVADMEAKMAAIARGQRGITAQTAAKAKVAAAQEAVKDTRTREDREVAEEREKARLAQQLLRTRVKPGKAINIRVIDPDRSRTPEIDELTVSIESSSGDSIGVITLKETDTHSGWFEGKVPTAGAQAMAFAANTAPGRNPNMVISPTPGYSAWRPVPVRDRKPEFKIDLNDNVALGEMTIVAKEQGAKLRKFIVQTGMNAKEMTTVAVYPKNQLSLTKPWHPSVTIMNDTDHHHASNARSVYDLRELQDHLERGWLTQVYAAGVAENVAGPSAAMTSSIPKKVQWRRHNRHHNAHVIYRFRAYFYEPEDVRRRFKVELGKWTPPQVHPSVANPAQYLLAVDGRVITNKERPANLEGNIDLRSGIHFFEIWATGWDCRIGFGRSVKVLANLKDPETLTVCPDSFFDPDGFPKGALTTRNGKASIAAADGGKQFKVKFAPGSRTRLFNIVLVGQEGPVPALNRIALTDSGGKTVLPVKYDYAKLNKNDTLEILTGDKVAVRYVDDRFVSKDKEKHERFLNVSFSDARAGFVFFEMRKNHQGDMEPYYEDLIRFKHGEPLTLKIMDPDMDMTDKPDSVNVVLETRTGGKRKFAMKETGPSTAVFRLVVVPVAGKPAANNQVRVAAGGVINATYRDGENIRPGVPVNRYASVRHALYGQPKVRVSHVSVTPLDYRQFDPDDPTRRPPGMRGLNIGFMTVSERQAESRAEAARGAQGLLRGEDIERKNASGGLVRPEWQIAREWVDTTRLPAGGMTAVHGSTIQFEIEAPHLALRSGSRVSVYVQTDAGREQGSLVGGSLDDGAGGAAFDITVPGTMKLNAPLAGGGTHNRLHSPPQIPIYMPGYLKASDGSHVFKRSAELFGCSVSLIAGFLPREGVISEAEKERRRERDIPIEAKHGLTVRPGEKVHVGFQYTDQSGAERWLTASAKVITHPVLDVMGEDYRDEKTTAYVGENLFVRVVDLGADVSDESDRLSVTMRAKSGAKHDVELLEVDTHSGVFRGAVELSYVQKAPPKASQPGGQGTPGAEAEYSVRRDGFPVVYDDVVYVDYKDRRGQQARQASLRIMKGADGTIMPFSKKYEDPEMAMKTQFSLAEAYLEMAKRHRKLGEAELANHEYARAKDMLEKAMEMFRDPDTRAQAEYLLGNLTQEEADTTEEAELKEDRYRAALSRYMRVTGSYPDTMPASKAQFKIATVYERMNEPEIAAQEYVKLAYKYPNSEFLALSMARLGTHFQRKAAQYEKKAKALLAKTEDKDAQFDGEAMQKMCVKEYIKSGEIFARLQERFPDHELAGKGGLRAGQMYMRAGDNGEAAKAFKRVIEHEAYDGPKIRAQAMYWIGLCYENLRQDMAAYSMYKRLTYDFPESKWASYARSQLSSERLLTLEEGLEIKRVEEGR